MTTEQFEDDAGDQAPPPADQATAPEPGPYELAIEEYLEAATWLGPGEAPFKVHARSIAKSLDGQLERDQQVQSALASSFDKVMVRLEARRPPPPPTPTDPAAPSPDGTASIFTQLDG